MDDYTNNVDPDTVVSLAEEAHRLAPSVETHARLIGAYAFRICKNIGKSNKNFADFYIKYTRSLGEKAILGSVTAQPGPFQKLALEHPDMLKILVLIEEGSRAFPADPAMNWWWLTRQANPALAEKIAESLRKSKRQELGAEMGRTLLPLAGSAVLNRAWLHEMRGHPEEARAMIQKAIADGVPLPPP
jgi:hypothetical protein